MEMECPNEPVSPLSTSIGKCHLFKLPAEIRNDIFEMALADDSYRTVDIWPVYMSYRPEPPPLTLVNRQLRTETLPVYRNQETVHIYAYVLDKWAESKAWLTKRREDAYFIRELKIIFTKYGGDILIIQGCIGRRPSYELIRNCSARRADTRRIGDYTYDERDLRTFVEFQIQMLMKKGGKDWFDVDEFTQFGDLFLKEYYDF